MNETIRELRCAMSLADSIAETLDDLYSYGIAAGIRFALEHLDEGSTETPTSPVYNINISGSDADPATRTFDARIDSFMAHGY